MLRSREILGPLAPGRVNQYLFLDRHAQRCVVLARGGQVDTSELSKSISVLLWYNARLGRIPALVSSEVWRLGFLHRGTGSVVFPEGDSLLLVFTRSFLISVSYSFLCKPILDVSLT